MFRLSKFASRGLAVSSASLKSVNVVRAFSAQTFLDRSEVSDRVLNVIKNFDKVEATKVTEPAKFIEDLGLDSLDVVEVVMALEEEFVIEIPDQEAEKLTTPEQVIEYVVAHPMAK